MKQIVNIKIEINEVEDKKQRKSVKPKARSLNDE